MVPLQLRSRWLWAVMVLASPASLRAQVVQGRVADDKSDKPIRAVTVALLDSAQTLVASTETAEDGSYQLRAPAPGKYVVWARLPGYRPVAKGPIELSVGRTHQYSPKLQPLPPVTLSPVVVEGQRIPIFLEGFHQRRAAGRGDYLTREEIELWGVSEPTHLIPLLSGFTVEHDRLGNPMISSRREVTGQLRGGRGCPPLVFIDGLLVGDTQTYDIDTFLRVATIEAVEAYNGPALMPVEFNAPGAKCGALVFWTKR